MALLEINGVDAFYGRVQALHGVSLIVDKSEIVALIGSNGAGKTTTLRTISGLMHPGSGTITFDGKDITKTAAHKIVNLGICQSPEGRRLFPRMQVVDNLQMGAYTRTDKPGIQEDMERVFTLFPRLKEREHQLAGTLSGGEQQMLAVGRALMSRPKLLMLDEPSLGLAPILLVEQNAVRALEVAHRGYVLETGNVVQKGTGKELLNSPDVQRAYLGM